MSAIPDRNDDMHEVKNYVHPAGDTADDGAIGEDDDARKPGE